MKKSTFLVLVMIITLSASVFGADRVDMIVLLDNSVSVLPVYDRIQESLVGRIISEHLNPGDTFSLITFADSPEVEISREIKSQEDIDEILAYSTILQPMGNYTDLVLALRFLYKYTLDLPLSNRKKIVILTDGIHDPPPGSPYAYGSSETARAEVKKAAEEIHREGWDVSIVELEENTEISDRSTTSDKETQNVTGDDQFFEEDSTQVNLIDTVADGLGREPNVFSSDEDDMAGIALGIPVVSIPEHLGRTTGELNLPLNIVNRSNEAIFFSISAVVSEGNDLLTEKVSIMLEPKVSGKLDIELLLPEESIAGEKVRLINLKLGGGLKSDPQSFNISYTYDKKGNINRGMDFVSDWRIIALIIGILIAVIVIFMIKKASASAGSTGPVYAIKAKEDDKTPVTVVSGPEDGDDEQRSELVNSKYKDHKDPVAKNRTPGATEKTRVEEEVFISTVSPAIAEALIHNKNRPIRMFVSGQNTKLGILNTQWLGENIKRTVGGATSASFRIFFVRIPSVIARIECTGTDFIFYPEKAEFFPELEGPLSECLNKKIKVVNEDQKVFYLEFRQWISELERVNRLLSMTSYTGKPDINY